jgi:hypothetical protein
MPALTNNKVLSLCGISEALGSIACPLDLCINMNNHQNAIFHQLDNFIKHSHSFAMAIFHKITKSAKLVIIHESLEFKKSYFANKKWYFSFSNIFC